MKLSRFGTVLLGAASVLALAACGNDTSPDKASLTPTPIVQPVSQETPPAGQLPEGVTPTAYRLDLKTDPREMGFSGTVEIDVDLNAPHSRIWLHSVDQDILLAQAVLADGTVIPATFTGDQAPGGVSRLDFESPLPAGKVTLELDYTAPYNMGLAGLYKAVQSNTDYLATQMEPIDARRMLPSFDEPRFKTPWTVTVTAPTGMAVVANGAETETEELGDGWTRHAFATTRPIQSYLLALAVGPYEMVTGNPIPATELRSEPVPLRAFAAIGKSGKLSDAVDITDEMVLWQESYFDYPYPYGKLDLIAVPEFAYGAMENAGAIIYREGALLIDDQTSLSHRRGIFTTHAHELGHQWFGNLVTPKWWNDIWLNEAFATWISLKTMNVIDPEGGWELAPIMTGLTAMGTDSLVTARQIRNPINANGDILDAFDAITYRKGGSVLNMFETYLGQDAFREGIRLHMRRFADGVADADDFMQSLAEGSGQPGVVDAFTSYINQPGIPALDVQVTCEAPDAGLITVTQKRYAPLGSQIDTGAQTWNIPFAARVSSPSGDGIVRQMLVGQTTEIPLDGACADWVMPNAGGTGYWRFDTNPENLAALTENLTTLSGGEQIMFADALGSGFKAGRINTEDLLDGIEATVDGHPFAVATAADIIPTLDSLLASDDKAGLHAWVQSVFGPLADRLDSQPATALDPKDILLRDELYSLLLTYGDLPKERAVLFERAKAYVGVDGEPDPKAIAPEDLSAAMTVGVQEGDEDFYDAAIAYVQNSTNQTERATILRTIASESDERGLADIMKAVQGNGFSGNEVYTVMTSAMYNGENQATAWNIFKASFDNILPLIPEIRKPQIAGITGSFCTAAETEEASTFFEAHADQIPGYERSLAQGVERSQLCSALKAAKAEEVKAAFEDN